MGLPHVISAPMHQAEPEPLREYHNVQSFFRAPSHRGRQWKSRYRVMLGWTERDRGRVVTAKIVFRALWASQWGPMSTHPYSIYTVSALIWKTKYLLTLPLSSFKYRKPLQKIGIIIFKLTLERKQNVLGAPKQTSTVAEVPQLYICMHLYIL